LVGSDPERAAEATITLVDKHGLTPGEILAKAYSQVSLQVEVHEKKVAELEKRRQRLKEEYDRLRSVRREPAEDAEIVG
jgi:cell division protein FtsB